MSFCTSLLLVLVAEGKPVLRPPKADGQTSSPHVAFFFLSENRSLLNLCAMSQAFVRQETGEKIVEGSVVSGYSEQRTGPADPSQSDSGIKDPLAYIGKPAYTEAEPVSH